MLTEYDQQHHHQGGYTPYDQRGYQQYEQQQGQQRPNVLERGRAVRLMRNGDPFFTGRTFVINQRKYPMLDVFLDDASQALRANFGAVRCIYTPKHGTRLRDIQDFEDHCTYVAAGGERFKKLHYLDIAEGKRIATKGQISPKLPPVRRMDVEGRALKLSRSENMIIYVYRNGDPLTLPAKVLLVKSTLQNWESILDEVTRKVSPSNSAVLKLYALNGELITSAQQLEYNGMYVAAGKERYRRIDYPDPKSLSPSFSPKMSRKSYTKSDGTNTHTTTATSYGSTDHPGQRRPVRGDDYDFFNNKPQQHRRGPTKETDLDRDDGGIYKGRMTHRERPREIDDTRDTRVDLPVDYGEAETVDEENLYGGRGGKTPRRAPPPPQSFSDPRSRQTKSPQKNHNDDDNRYPPYGHTRNNNGYDNDHHRTPTQPDDDQYEPPLPHTTHRQPLISSSTQTHQDQRQHYQMQHEESNIDRYRESSQMMEHDYDNDDDRV